MIVTVRIYTTSFKITFLLSALGRSCLMPPHAQLLSYLLLATRSSPFRRCQRSGDQTRPAKYGGNAVNSTSVAILLESKEVLTAANSEPLFLQASSLAYGLVRRGKACFFQGLPNERVGLRNVPIVCLKPPSGAMTAKIPA